MDSLSIGIMITAIFLRMIACMCLIVLAKVISQDIGMEHLLLRQYSIKAAMAGIGESQLRYQPASLSVFLEVLLYVFPSHLV